MQLMCDAVTVLGSRHGLLLNPMKRQAGIIRFDIFEKMPLFELRVGAVIDGREYVFPFCGGGEAFDHYDQRLTPCTMSVIGVHAAGAIKVKLTIATPFRPRDAEFSTTPVLAVSLSAERLHGHSRWTSRTCKDPTVELFVELGGERLTLEPSGTRDVDIGFTSRSLSARPGFAAGSSAESFAGSDLPQRDRLVAVDAERRGTRFVKTAALDQGPKAPLLLGWCTHSGPVLEVLVRHGAGL